ncbi:MAG: hypothetical protein KKA31_02260 [Candidatus Margulisbacteria bacterium]|nr:hypothetical protein [Candidatus Margulisiibacteriota bacterium]
MQTMQTTSVRRMSLRQLVGNKVFRQCLRRFHGKTRRNFDLEIRPGVDPHYYDMSLTPYDLPSDTDNITTITDALQNHIKISDLPYCRSLTDVRKCAFLPWISFFLLKLTPVLGFTFIPPDDQQSLVLLLVQYDHDKPIPTAQANVIPILELFPTGYKPPEDIFKEAFEIYQISFLLLSEKFRNEQTPFIARSWIMAMHSIFFYLGDYHRYAAIQYDVQPDTLGAPRIIHGNINGISVNRKTIERFARYSPEIPTLPETIS